jgi:hypothetical protein
MEMTMTKGFCELDENEMYDMEGGKVTVIIPIVGPIYGLQVTYNNSSAISTAGWTIAGGISGGPVGAFAGFAGATTDAIANGNATVTSSWFMNVFSRS